MYWFITACIALFVVFITWTVSNCRPRSSPPGPFPLPYFGNLLYIARQHPVNFIALQKISNKYGKIASLQIGPNPNILLSSCECVKDIYSRPDCLNRPINGSLWDRMLKQNIGTLCTIYYQPNFLDSLEPNLNEDIFLNVCNLIKLHISETGMAFSNDEGWNSIRKFSSRALREFGFGSEKAMEKLILIELRNLMTFIDSKLMQTNDKVLYFNHFFQPSFLNLMSSMISGKSHSYEDRELQKLVKASNEWFETPLLGILTTMAFPWTRYVFPSLLGYTKQMNALQHMYAYAWDLLEKHRRSNKYLEEANCFTDTFLKMAHDHKDDPSSIFTDDQFAVLCTDLIQGGSDTTSNWLSFAILLLILHPEIQEKVFEEIGKEIGFDRLPVIQDQDRMIYTQAVMYEIHRWARITVVMPPRVATEDFQYCNYQIKKGTTILGNLHSCFMDPNVWKNPECFRPNRFLSADGCQLVNTEVMSISFGAGRRICFGESLAKESSFLYLTSLLQNYSFKKPPANYSLPDAEPVTGIVLSPKPYHVHIERRRK